MSQKELFISHLVSGGIISNYHCSSSCRHCLYRCSPRWPKEYISRETVRENLETIRSLGCTSIHIGGGEPLLNPGCVASALGVAAEIGIHVEYVETNSSWYQNLSDACAMLERLADRGLSTLLVSMSPFHNEHVPFYKVKGVIEASARMGIEVFPWISAFIPDIGVFDDKNTHSLEEYRQYYGEKYLENLPRRYWVSTGGRALETFGEFSVGKSVSELVAARKGCGVLAEVSHFHLDLYGNYVPGLCAGLSIRREHLGAPLSVREYPIISRLYAAGIGGFAAYAAEEFGFRPSKATFASDCELCYEIRRYLVVDKGIDSPELQPRGHYLYG